LKQALEATLSAVRAGDLGFGFAAGCEAVAMPRRKDLLLIMGCALDALLIQTLEI